MDKNTIIQSWKSRKNMFGQSAVCITDAMWNTMAPETSVKILHGEQAWNFLYTLYPICWDARPSLRLAYRNFMQQENSLFRKVIRDDQLSGRLNFYRQHGLTEPVFCAFSDELGLIGVLMDGNHRFVDCNYLMRHEGMDFSKDIARATLTIFYIPNIANIIPRDYPLNQNAILVEGKNYELPTTNDDL